jgi:hypothetical protein
MDITKWQDTENVCPRKERCYKKPKQHSDNFPSITGFPFDNVIVSCETPIPTMWQRLAKEGGFINVNKLNTVTTKKSNYTPKTTASQAKQCSYKTKANEYVLT